ncbi:hypothetical protein NHX12_000725 [Muraenolepis orangiensis]|uniref:Uncharacterized protein n=1 Tax=Muraenolepis orangiensis TaxID=630683 RepID=A0A9Q0E146_9TELE|nr:hypothetical protein NHX12_000725 [Muraenolepis orangiensis]
MNASVASCVLRDTGTPENLRSTPPPSSVSGVRGASRVSGASWLVSQREASPPPPTSGKGGREGGSAEDLKCTARVGGVLGGLTGLPGLNGL